MVANGIGASFTQHSVFEIGQNWSFCDNAYILDWIVNKIFGSYHDIHYFYAHSSASPIDQGLR